jgi:hypothetical protein
VTCAVHPDERRHVHRTVLKSLTSVAQRCLDCASWLPYRCTAVLLIDLAAATLTSLSARPLNCQRTKMAEDTTGSSSAVQMSSRGVLLRCAYCNVAQQLIRNRHVIETVPPCMPEKHHRRVPKACVLATAHHLLIVHSSNGLHGGQHLTSSL